jgi:hypothetical protein
MPGSFENDVEPSGFIDHVSGCQRLKMDAPSDAELVVFVLGI